MDWNMDGRVDGLDAYVFNEIINDDGGSNGENGGETACGNGNGRKASGAPVGNSKPLIEISPLCWFIIWMTVLLSLYMLVAGGIDAADTMAGIGFIIFLIVRWLEG